MINILDITHDIKYMKFRLNFIVGTAFPIKIIVTGEQILRKEEISNYIRDILTSINVDLCCKERGSK